MIIKKNTEFLVLRIKDYKDRMFVEEHLKILSNKGQVWFLKMGRELNINKLRHIIECGGNIILKESKKNGNRYYYIHMIDYYNGDVDKNKDFPDYYYDMMGDYNSIAYDSLKGTWIKIDRIMLMHDGVKNIRLLSNGKKLDEVINTTRSALLYAYNETEISL